MFTDLSKAILVSLLLSVPLGNNLRSQMFLYFIWNEDCLNSFCYLTNILC